MRAFFPVAFALATVFTGALCGRINFQVNLEGIGAHEECSNYQGQDTCRGDQIDYPESAETRRWQTPPPGDSAYKPEWQSYAHLQGYAQIQYTTESREEATVRVRTWTRQPTKLRYRFGDAGWTENPELTVKRGMFEKGLAITAWAPDLANSTLILDPLFFVWQSPVINRPETRQGQRGAIVELFGWPYDDIAKECEMVGKAGYMGVKIFPAQGVRVYADAVINHMSGGGNDVLTHRNGAGGSCTYWGPKNSSGNSPYFTHSWAFEPSPFTGERPALEYPAVPFGPTDFHCERTMGDWASPLQLNYGWLVGLSDLNTERPYVQERIADYLVDLMSIGFSGFRIDAAKHIRPDDLAAILGKFKEKMSGIPDDFITWLEVILGGEKQLLACDHTPYNYYTYLDEALAKNGLSSVDIQKVKVWSSDYPKEHPACGRWILPASRFAIQNDDHDQQNPGSSSRDMGDTGSVLIKEKNVDRHRAFELQLFQRGDADWNIKLILSSFTFMNSGAQGYPDGLSDCSKYLGNQYSQKGEQCFTVPYQRAHDPNVCGYTVNDKSGGWGEGQYTRVHRDAAIIRAMRQWTGLESQASNAELGIPASC